MKKLTFIALALVSIMLAACRFNVSQSDLPIYLDASKDVEARVEDALSRMTLEEKIGMVHAQSKFSSPGVPRLGIPEVWCTDGPHGIRPEVKWDEWDQAGWTNDSCTAFPALTALAATWDEDLSLLYGKSIGAEARYRNKNILLGPGVNIYRSPFNGRNFEYMGEDPYLASKMVVPYIKGVQENKVAVCVKHYALNNTEIRRHTTNVHVDDRTLYEIYLPAFKAAVQEGEAWSIMSSYNLYEGKWVSHSDRMLNQILKGEFGFDGVVVSDWGGTHDTEGAVLGGLDLEYGSWTDGLTTGQTNAYDNYFLAQAYLEGIKSGKYGTKELDDKCRRILRLIFRTTMAPDRPYGSFTSPEHYAAARKIGAEGIVLLKNDGVLPIDLNKVKKVLVVGENAVKMMTVGGGSSSLKVKEEVSPLQGLVARLDGIAEVVYERGYVGDPSGSYNGVVTGQDLSESRSAEELIADAVSVAKDADYVIFIGGLNKSANQDCEDSDRLSYGLPYEQDAVIEALAEANKNLVVVNISGNAVAMPWVDKVPAIVQDWYLGSQAGNSLADVLVGDVNPSGKLPFTFPVAYEDGPLRTEEQYPGVDEGRTGGVAAYDVPIYEMRYTEGIYVGYRWYEAQDIKPLFAFGHGLSYTTFEFGDAKAKKSSMRENGEMEISVTVKNTGSLAGAEVVQLYISDSEASVDRPVKELKGFKKVFLEPGQKADVVFTINKDALSFFDADKHEWVAEKGEFTALIGNASDKIHTSVSFELK